MSVWLPDDTIRAMISEVLAFANRGLTPAEAMQTVGLPDNRRVSAIFATTEGNRRFYLPTPAEIDHQAAAIRSGAIVVSAQSVARYGDHREFDQRYDLAGELPEDAAGVPPWLYSADRDA